MDRLTRARHQGWLAYNLAMSGDTGAAEVAVTTALAEEISDPQARTLATVARCCLLGARGEWTGALAELERLLVDARGKPREPYLAVPEFHHANLLAVGQQRTSRRQLIDAAEQRPIGRMRYEMDVEERLAIPLQRYAELGKRLDLRGHVERAAVDRVVERLDAETVARREQLAVARIPDGKRKLAAQRVHRARAAGRWRFSRAA